MPPRRNKEKFQQFTEFERGRITGPREGGFSYRAIGARVQRNSSTVMRAWKQWTDEHRTTRKTGNERRKETSARDDRHLLRITVNGRITSSRQLAARWSTATARSRSLSLRHPGVIFQKDNARPRVAKTVRDFCSAQHMQLLPWPAYSPDMLPIERVWDLVGRRLARDLRPAASKDELLLRIQAIWNSLPQADIQNLFDTMPHRIAVRGGYTKY
ncbi:transposable element Tcb2 transposase [Trichonephila clavipes]|nr:transposable element Tcb2 transposase [Trichonephila clavipes]